MPGEDERSEVQQESVDTLREQLASGFAYVRSREVTASIAAMTYEEALMQAVSDIEEDESDIRPGRLTSVRTLRSELIAAVDQAMQMPASTFEHQPSQGHANTDIDGEGPTVEDEG